MISIFSGSIFLLSSLSCAIEGTTARESNKHIQVVEKKHRLESLHEPYCELQSFLESTFPSVIQEQNRYILEKKILMKNEDCQFNL
jgi:hypothetical protein